MQTPSPSSPSKIPQWLHNWQVLAIALICVVGLLNLAWLEPPRVTHAQALQATPTATLDAVPTPTVLDIDYGQQGILTRGIVFTGSLIVLIVVGDTIAALQSKRKKIK